jgi:hypothetical protein
LGSGGPAALTVTGMGAKCKVKKLSTDQSEFQFALRGCSAALLLQSESWLEIDHLHR